MKLPGVILSTMFVLVLSTSGSATASCESLTSLSLPETTITLAQTVAAGALTLPTPFPTAGARGGISFVSVKELPELGTLQRHHFFFIGPIRALLRFRQSKPSS
jgi:hypothetical protein